MIKMEQYTQPKLEKFKHTKLERKYWDPREWGWSSDPSVQNKEPKQMKWDSKALEFKVIN